MADLPDLHDKVHHRNSVLKLMAQSGAESWWVYPIELADVVDPLQAYAERSGLVHLIGQDAVQAIIAEPFARLRQPVEPEAIPLAPEPAPAPKPRKRAYQTPQATVDAFLHVVRNESAEYLRDWLARHPLDAPELHKMWKKRCSAATT